MTCSTVFVAVIVSLPFLSIMATNPPSTCPCSDQSLCDPVTRKPAKEVFVFSVGGKNWKKYDWSKVTSIVMFNDYDAELMCYAHSKQVKVLLKGDFPVANLTDIKARENWLLDKLRKAADWHMDGINLDIEQPINDSSIQQKLLTDLVEQTTKAFHVQNPHSQVTYDVAWSPDCIDGRCYNYKAIADAVDFVFVMSYDEQSQIFGPCIGMANSPYNKTVKGVEKYLEMGIPANKLVLGVPWYGYNYPCLNVTEHDVCYIPKVPFRGANCSDAAGKQKDYSEINRLIQNSTTGRKWNDEYKAPYFNYKDSKQVYQVWYDDPQSLKLRYDYAESKKLLGVGMWHADALDYSDDKMAQKQTKEMWDALPHQSHGVTLE
ncbi:di-N-acetylchitobiase-like [Saccoglossus kowalevskii]|uniref:Di-N-acetylchitobiase-like n=1 Tax=Saccoglossus kowalevskii TaxID=10224 RepID=A0ABM0GVU2_SACKO|nr:PREDICTED: di-N-acetylchitobiase-like [Saccoglossus kowalevskii]